ncbi:hypothetical protein [Enterobacter oligotrophicus]|uniref:hypothetical protein n=1 Tax=Enterobacter oligotrophicus TaxID=2478464 RepID=UPI000367B3C7|nr:hypothetical protein [Enterobacter oligotrophicus]
MNYSGNEEVRDDLKKFTEALYEVFRQASAFESRYKWNKGTLVERLAGTAVGDAKDGLAEIYRKIAEVEHQFQD